jgi:hypothetical protein
MNKTNNYLLFILSFVLIGINNVVFATNIYPKFTVADASQPGTSSPAKKEQEAAENWSAIAIDSACHDRNCAYGVGGGSNKDDAEKYAQKFCDDAGGEKCKVVVSYQQCAAYALSKNHNGIGTGETKALSEQRAQKQCKDRDCYIIASDCN